MENKRDKFINELHLESYKASEDYNRNVALIKAKEILYKYYPKANMLFENMTIDFFLNLVELEYNRLYIEDCIESYDKKYNK